MALTVAATGTTSALSSTETTLDSAQTTAGIYVCALDLNPMASGDVIELLIYTKTLTGSTERLLDRVSFANSQGDPNFQTVPIVSPYSVRFALRQPTGTGRTIDFALISL